MMQKLLLFTLISFFTVDVFATTINFESLFRGQSITDDTARNIFESQVLRSKIPVIMKISTPTCGPCIMTKKPYETLSKNYHNKVTFMEMDATRFMRLSSQLAVSRVPLFIYFYNGLEQKRFTGKDGLNELILYLQNQIKQ